MLDDQFYEYIREVGPMFYFLKNQLFHLSLLNENPLKEVKTTCGMCTQVPANQAWSGWNL
ncbi:hypothetical protein HK096_006697 [Nowakowskiella sp. JEL0078]|nr:hypothetical protein HK096_006697 [Nowakowskiella sp. JEL0078]